MDRPIIELLIGGVFVIVYSCSRFSSDKIEDHLEVKSRFLFALLAYISFYIILYATLTFIISFGVAIPFLGIETILNDLRKTFPGENQQISAQLLAALLLTEGLPRIKKAAAADNKLRELFQRMASLSSTAQNLSSKFQNEAFDFREGKDKIKELKQSFEEQELDESDIQIEVINEGDRKPKHIWTRISLLWISINEWQNLPEYKNFLNSHLNRFKRMKDEYESLAQKVSHCFALTDAVERAPDLKSALQECADHYSIQLKKHLQKVSDFISCALLNVKKGDDARSKAIGQIGFKPEYNKGVSIDQIVLLFISLFSIYIIVFGILHLSSSQGTGPLEAFIKAIMISGILIVSIACALVAKKRCDQKGKTHHAYATYGSWAIVAVIIGSLISILMNTIVKEWSLQSGFYAFVGGGEQVPKAPWQLLAFATTFLTAYQLNRQEVHQKDVTKLRVKEALSMGMLLCIALFIAGHLMSFKLFEFYTRGIIVLIVGSIIGYFIPTWYRGVPKHDKEPAATETEYAELNP